MLFIQSNSLALSPDEGGRLRLLDALAGRGLAPLVRSRRRRIFGALVGDGSAAAAAELERACAARGGGGAGGQVAYTPGELFRGAC